MVPPDLLAQRNVLFLVNEHSICPVSFLENQPPQAVDFEGELSILLSQFFNFSPQISGPFLFYIGGSCRVQAFPLESLEALICPHREKRGRSSLSKYTCTGTLNRTSMKAK
jgi:hypothetical protein